MQLSGRAACALVLILVFTSLSSCQQCEEHLVNGYHMPFIEHSGGVAALVEYADSLWSAGYDGVITRWIRRKEGLVKVDEFHHRATALAAFNGSLWTGDDDGMVIAWNPAGDRIREFNHGAYVYALIEYWSSLISTGGDGKVIQWYKNGSNFTQESYFHNLAMTEHNLCLWSILSKKMLLRSGVPFASICEHSLFPMSSQPTAIISHDEHLWIAGEDLRIILIRSNRSETSYTEKAFKVPNRISAMTVFEDNVWVADVRGRIYPLW